MFYASFSLGYTKKNLRENFKTRSFSATFGHTQKEKLLVFEKMRLIRRYGKSTVSWVGSIGSSLRKRSYTKGDFVLRIICTRRGLLLAWVCLGLTTTLLG